MGKFDISKTIKTAKLFANKHAPEILMWVGTSGLIATTVLAVSATPKALRLIEQEKDELEVDKLTPVETVKATWKCYVPAATTCILSVACLASANKVTNKRTAALAAAYKISETALSEYKDKVVEVIGEKKEKVIRDAIDKDHIEKNPVSKQHVIITEKGNTLFYDAHSGRYFHSDIEQIRRAINNLNKQMLQGDSYVSLNDFYDEVDSPDLSHSEMGDELGWSIDDGLLDVEFGSQITDDGRPCIVLNYNIYPKYNYYKLG